MNIYGSIKQALRDAIGPLPKGKTFKKMYRVHYFHRNMKVVPRSQRHLGINCNKNGVAL